MTTSHGKQPRRLGTIAAAVGLTASAFLIGSSGIGTLPLAQAATGSVASSVVTVTPARAADTRSATGLGGPILANKSVKLDVTGAIPTRVGSDDVTATVVPDGATGVLLNVTAVRPDAGGFVSIRPGDATGEPSTSNLNVQAGSAIPNAVTVSLPTSGAAAGTIDIWYGTGNDGARTNLLVDIVGYTVEATGGSGATGPAGPVGPTGAAGLAGSDGVDATTPDNVVWVAPSGGDYTLLSAAIAESSPNTLIRVAPGTYTETAPVELASNMTIQGSGRDVTIITCACAGNGSAASSDFSSSTLVAFVVGGVEVSDLSIVNTGGTDLVAIGMTFIGSSGVTLDDVAITASGADANFALNIHDNSEPRIHNVAARAFGGSFAFAMSASNDSSARLTRSTFIAEGASDDNTGIILSGSSSPTMDDVAITASGGIRALGIDADSGSEYLLTESTVEAAKASTDNEALTGDGAGRIADTEIDGDATAGAGLTCFNVRDPFFVALDAECD